VKQVNFDLDGHHLFLIGGKNGQGKSSAIKSLLMALCGKRDFDWPEIPLKEGEDEGWVRVLLSGDDELHEAQTFTLELLFKRRRGGAVVESFRILDSAGDEAPEPRQLLKRLYHFRGFDPGEFDRLPKAERRKMLMQLCGLDFEADEQKIKSLYDERTAVNRELKTARTEMAKLEKHDDAPEQEVSVADLVAEMDRRQKWNEETGRLKQRVDGCLRASDKEQDDILREESEIARLKAEIAKCEKRIEQAQERAAEHHAAWGKATAELNKRVVADVDQIKQQIRDAGQINAMVRENREFEKAESRVIHLEARSDDLTNEMGEIRQEQERALREAQWPVEHLSVDSDGVLFGGLPYEQASKSQRIVVSTKIGMALNPKLRLLVCEDGSDMDVDTLAALDAMLKENDFQMVVELVTRSDEDEDRCAVVIEAGKVK
jgi:DNA repair exonuclease SbcCD ATPase subunit